MGGGGIPEVPRGEDDKPTPPGPGAGTKSDGA